MRITVCLCLMVVVFLACASVGWCEPLLYPSSEAFKQEDAAKMRGPASALAPVYGPLAEYLVAKFGLADKEGIGIDVGGGPGDLVIELSKRTRMYWINSDINPCYSAKFFEAATAAGVGERVGAMFADAQALPFRDSYADVVVSRGSFPFWEDKRLGFAEIYRVLKPGGVAYIGRGFSENLPVDVARGIRDRQKQGGKHGPPPYDVDETERELRSMMKSLRIKQYTIHRPEPPGSEGVNYGIWIEIHKCGKRKCNAQRP